MPLASGNRRGGLVGPLSPDARRGHRHRLLPALVRFYRFPSARLATFVVAAMVAVFRPSALDLAAGFGAWFWAEYGLHRVALHRPSPFWARHQLHHRHPGDDRWLPIPLAWTAALLGGAAVVFGMLAGLPRVPGLLAGFALGLGYFEWCHFVAHRPIAPRTPVGRWIKRRHLAHHVWNDAVWFGITPGAGVLDHLFGTAPSHLPPRPKGEEAPPLRLPRAQDPLREHFQQWWESLPPTLSQAWADAAARAWLHAPGLTVMEGARRRHARAMESKAWQGALAEWCQAQGLWTPPLADTRSQVRTSSEVSPEGPPVGSHQKSRETAKEE